MSVKIVVDSASDFADREYVKELGIEILPLITTFGEEEFLDGVDMTHDEFFEKLIETDIFPTTSQISPYRYNEVFEKYTEAGDQVVCITLSSKLSGCYQSALISAQEYADSVFVVDSENACVGERILVEYAVRLRDEGKTAAEIADLLNKKKKNIRLVALLDTLEYLKKGGRISAATAMAGSLLSIKPVIAIMRGEVVVLGKARGSKAGNNKLTELIDNEGGIDYSMPFCLAYSGLSDHLLQKYIADFSHLHVDKVDKLPISSIGCAIGSHIGPGAIGVTFFVED